MIKDITTIIWRDWTVLKRRLKKFLLSRLVTPVMYMLAFGWGLGRSIDFEGGRYIDFLVPGIIALNVMNVSYMSVSSIHAEKVYHKSLEEYMLAPISTTAYVTGKIISAIIRSLISTAIIMCVAAMFGAEVILSAEKFADFIFVIILTAIIFAGVGICAAMRVRTYEELAQVNTYILMPMSFMCGTFFSTEKLPEVLRIFVELLPLAQANEILRFGINLKSAVILAVYAAIMIYIALREFGKRS